MTAHYREFAVSVDPEFARQLKVQLDARRDRPRESANPSPADDQPIHGPRITEVTLVRTPDKQPDHRWRRVGLLAAAVAAVVAGTVLVVVTADDDSDPRTVDTPPSTSADRQFAADVALTPSDWGPNYEFGRFANLQFSMTRELAETLPECEPFLDTAFESPRRPATVTITSAATGATAMSAHWQYVVVFADVAGAEAMMDALHDPRYPDCDKRYRDELSISGVANAFRINVRPQVDLAGDDSVNFIPAVRAGRTVMMFDSEYDDDELVAIVARAVERVEAAEAGAPLASAPLPLEYLTKSALPRDSQLGAVWSYDHGPQRPWQLSRPLGLSVPSCAAFVDVFLPRQIPPGWGEDHDESRPFAYDSVSVGTDPQAVDAVGDVFRVMTIGYARQQAAEDAMDAISDPGFPRCLADYTAAEPSNEAWQATTREPISVSPLSQLGDESVQMLFEGTFTGLNGTTSPTRPIVAAFVRVDQVLIGVEVTVDHMSTDELKSMLQQTVPRVEAAIAGAPIPFSL